MDELVELERVDLAGVVALEALPHVVDQPRELRLVVGADGSTPIDSSHMLATLCVGDRVRIGQRVSPRYLAGLDGTIVELDDRAATVRLDSPIGRFESGRVRCPPLVLEKP